MNTKQQGDACGGDRGRSNLQPFIREKFFIRVPRKSTYQAQFQCPDPASPELHNLLRLAFFSKIHLDTIPPAFALHERGQSSRTHVLAGPYSWLPPE